MAMFEAIIDITVSALWNLAQLQILRFAEIDEYCTPNMIKRGAVSS